VRIHEETLNRHKLNLLKRGAENVNQSGENLVDIGLFRDNINSYNNWQKLRYHGLIAKTGKRGEWVITSNGWKFLRGEISLPKYILVADNRIIEHAETRVEMQDLLTQEEVVQETFDYYEPTYKPQPLTLQFAFGETIGTA
jgi:hypothetical protein